MSLANIDKTRLHTSESHSFEETGRTKRHGLTFQIFSITFSSGALSQNQNVKQKVSFHNCIISKWYKSNHVRAIIEDVKVSQAVREGKQT